MALAVLDSDVIAHPALEVVFTVDEEIGMEGAQGLDFTQLSARRMLNVDSEDEGIFTVSCAGGVVVTYTCPIAREHKTGSTLTLDISGLLGGHSGNDINLERGNGNLIMARIIGVPRAFARAASRYRYGIMRHFSCVKKRTTSQDSSS